MGLFDRFKKAPEPEVSANDKHLSHEELRALDAEYTEAAKVFETEKCQEIWFRHPNPDKPQVNAGYIFFHTSMGTNDIKVTRWDDEKTPRDDFTQFMVKHVKATDIFASREDLIAANEERLQQKASEQSDDFTKAVEDIFKKEAGQEL